MTHIIEIKVMPNSGRQQLMVDKAGILKCFLKSPPEKGLANQELLRFIAKTIQLPITSIKLVAGATGRKKLLSITTTLSLQELLKKLGIEQQQSLFKK